MKQNFLNFAALKIAVVIRDNKCFKTAEMNARRQTLMKQSGTSSRKQFAGRTLPKKAAKETNRSRRETLTNTFRWSCPFELVSVPTICGSFWISWRECPSISRRFVVPQTRSFFISSADENCIKIDFQADWNCHVALRLWSLVLKMELSKVVVAEVTNQRCLKKEKEDSK